MNVLLVDNEPVILKSVGDFLKRSGHWVQTALRGGEALELLLKNKVDVIISDLRLSGMTGFDLLAAVQVRHPQIPVVFISEHGDVRIAQEALKKGAVDFLQKPLQLDKLIEVLDRIDQYPNVAQTLNRLAQAYSDDGDLGLAVRRYLEDIQTHWKRLMPALDALDAVPASNDFAACVSAIDHLVSRALRETECLAKFGDPKPPAEGAPQTWQNDTETL